MMSILQFTFRSASPTFKPVTSVAFLPLSSRDPFTDFLENVFNETTPGGPERKEREHGKVVEPSVPGSEVFALDSDELLRGFGFQIHSGDHSTNLTYMYTYSTD